MHKRDFDARLRQINTMGKSVQKYVQDMQTSDTKRRGIANAHSVVVTREGG